MPALDFHAMLVEARAKRHVKEEQPEMNKKPLPPPSPPSLHHLALDAGLVRPCPVPVGIEPVSDDILYANDFLSRPEESRLLEGLVPDESWVRVSGRRLLRFEMPLPRILKELASAVGAALENADFDHCLINSYEPGEGIMAHTDGPAYEHLTATISCGCDRIVRFKKRLKPCQVGGDVQIRETSILLRRRSLLIFRDSAYIHHTHSIEPAFFAETVEETCANAKLAGACVGDEIEVDSRRLSFTLRKVAK